MVYKNYTTVTTLSADMAGSVPFLAGGLALPIHSRIVRSHSKAPVNVPFISQRPPTYGGYSAVSMEKAYEAVTAGKMSVQKAAEEYGIPKSTLHDRVSGKVALKARSGRKKLLNDAEEASLIEFLVGCASIGYAKSRCDVLAIAQQIARTRDPHVEVSKGWWDSFRKRHPEILLRHAEPLSYARAIANNPEVIGKYFDLLEDTMKVNGLTQRPGQVFNCDEIGMALVHKPPKVITHKGQKHPYAVTSGDKSQITILACASASGYTIPPMVIFDRKHLQPEMTTGEVPGTFYGLLESGWMDAELFEEWFKHHFLVHAPSARPLLLLLDGHASHYNPGVLRMAAEGEIILFCLPPHTTHLLQPLDNGSFSSLKSHWRRECQQFYAQNPGKVISRRNFMGVFNKAWAQGMSISNVTGCFRATGVYPVDRRVPLSQLPQDTSSSPTRSAPTPYVPFCTPRKEGAPDVIPPCTEPPQPTFTADEVEQFQARLLESTDSRYTLWLETFYPQSSAQVRPGVLETILKRPPPPAQQKTHKYPLDCGRVLTSEQCIRQQEEKAEEKKKKQEEKEERMKERKRRREEKAEQKEAAKNRKGKTYALYTYSNR